jgi:hypothetical protein
MSPSRKDFPAAVEFIRTSLPKYGVNTLIVEINYGFDFQSRPEFKDSAAPGKAELQQLAKACRDRGIELIPMINCLGHQSWAKRNGRLIEKHPELDETPGKYPNNEGIYCRSYCPLHPDLHPLLFDLIDELIQATDARSFHVGMDEVFILADPDCPRCRGKDPAELFAGEVKALHKHLTKRNCRMWIWGDRFLDGKSTGLGKWEASENDTARSIDLVPRDIVICDWHYEKAPDTARLFALKGFDVVACPWRKPAVALDQLKQVQTIRSGKNSAAGRHALGMLQTTWCGFIPFVSACNALEAGTLTQTNSPAEVARCFGTLSKAIAGRK